MKVEEEINASRHFDVWDKFWGRPGNGASLGFNNKKHHIEKLLFPQKISMGVA